jgi:Putative Actinobacterial Holin-X, holin superfamily III
VASLLKLLITSGLFTDRMRAKFHAAKRSAGVVMALAITTVIAATIGSAGIAVAGYFALRQGMADYQAALIVAAIFIALGGISALVAISRIRRSFGGPDRNRVTMPLQDEARAGASPLGSEDPLVRLIVTGAQSPVVMSALALGILAGRMTKRSKRD